jgi:predicted Zn finger-like uncharacterized protein
MIADTMLVTSCPECKTTFRISVEILEKAGGQVRCGRCANIFDANSALREIDESAARPDTGARFRFEIISRDDAGGASDESEALHDIGLPDEDIGDADTELPPLTGDEDDRTPDSSPSEPVELASAESSPEDDEQTVATDPPSAAGERDRDAPPGGTDESDWLPDVVDVRRPRTVLWSCISAVLVLALGGQLAHQYRGSLILVPELGPFIESAYAALGQEVSPTVDLDQYELVDLTTVAESTDNGQNWLIIESRILNAGPKAQPYPYIFVRLLDRWGDTIAGRYFSANEYTLSEDTDFSRMTVGSRIDVQFLILDPGPSATGFELELCTKVERGFLCESDFSEN